MKITEQIQKTDEELFKDFLIMFTGSLSNFYQVIDVQHKIIFDMFWNGEFDQQKIVNVLGYEKSMELFQLSATLQQVLKAGDSDYKVLEPTKNVEFKDGQIIITDKVL